MPIVTCKGCGRTTNTAVCNVWDSSDNEGADKEIGVATECYAAWVEGKWVKGCGYDREGNIWKDYVDSLIAGERDGE